MTHLPPLISDLTYILAVATTITLIFKRLRQPIVLGYILSGCIVSPYFPGPNIIEVDNLKVWAELGVIFLMFSLGLEFSFRKVIEIGFPAALSGVLQILLLIGLGFSVGSLMGWSKADSWFLGCMISISSTMIIIKVFEDLKIREGNFVKMVFGTLVVEDLVAILILVALSSFSVKSDFGGIDLLISAGKLFLVVGTWFIFGMFLVPRFLELAGNDKSNEWLVLSSSALCLLLVYIASRFEYSVALGAFMMGSLLSETGEVSRIEKLIEPIRDLFGAIFFVSIGMLLVPAIIIDQWQLILILTFTVLVGKIFSGFIASSITGQTIQDSAKISLSKAQIGEFSFIIASLGVSLKVIDPKIFPVIVAVAILTTFLTPVLVKNSVGIGLQIESKIPARLLRTLERYSLWFRKKMGQTVESDYAFRMLGRWVASNVVVISVFEVVAHIFINHIDNLVPSYSNYVAWMIAFLISAPFLWVLVYPNRIGRAEKPLAVPVRRLSVIGALQAIFLMGFLSREFLSFLQALGLSTVCLIAIFLAFKNKLESRYRWIENQFLAGFKKS